MTVELTCRQSLSMLMAYSEGLLPQGPKRRVETHVSGCTLCQGFVRSYLATPGIVRRATAKRLPGRVARALQRRLAAARRR
ncbi:MAG TPA: zf-HC2 domain-containing protein [Vicinamibacteria bacterium]|jgi:anti-sigma factor RsiW|nr:zf-HC2 domain-containing protein [Vicinamibacteria bacterium]